MHESITPPARWVLTVARQRLATVTLACTLHLLPVAVTASEPVSLERALQIALANNPDARLAHQRIAMAEAGVQQAGAALWPQLQLGASYLRSDNPMMVFGAALNQQRFDFGMNFNDVPDADNLNANAAVVVPLYRGGQSSALKREARARAAAVRQLDEATRQALTLEVARAFFTARKTQGFIEATAAAVQSYESNLTTVQKRFNSGSALKHEVLDVEVRLAQAREDLARARNANALTLHALRNLLALEDPEIQISDQTPPLTAPAPEAVPHRAELEAAARHREAAETALARARGGYLPRVDAVGRYDYDHGWKFDGSGDSYTAGIQLQWNVWDGQLTRGRVNEARAAVESAVEEERKLKLAIELEISQARLNLREAGERLAVTEKAVEQASESAQLTRARFEQGLALATQVIDAETAHTGARVRRADAQADQWLAIAALRKALGLPLISLPVSSTAQP